MAAPSSHRPGGTGSPKMEQIMNAQDIIQRVREAGAEDPQSIRDTLCDGEALANLGIKDDDQEAVEEAYNIMLNRN